MGRRKQRRRFLCVRGKNNTTLWWVVTNSGFQPLQKAELSEFPFGYGWHHLSLPPCVRSLHTVSELRPLHHQHGYLCLTHFDLLPSRLLSTHKSLSLVKSVFSVVFNEQWTRATENNAHWNERKLRTRLIVVATHHFNSDSPLIGWTDVSFLIPKSFFPLTAVVVIVLSHGKSVSSYLFCYLKKK